MNKQTWIAVVGILLTSTIAGAVAVDPLYCEARSLIAESKFYRCLARCDRRLGVNEQFNVVRCEERCQNLMERGLDRIGRKQRCRPPTPDPNLCEARLLKVESQKMSCQSRCERKDRRIEDFDKDLCDATCAAVAEQATTEVMEEAICSEGRPPEATR